MFPIELASAMTGATRAQLYSWCRKGLLVPEYGTQPYAYSFRDLIALRTVARLRSDVPLQKIRKALRHLEERDLTDHPSAYRLIVVGGEVVLLDGEDLEELTGRPGQFLVALHDLYSPFTNFRGDSVVDFRRPRAHLEVREQRLGGWPTLADSRLPYDLIARYAEGSTPEVVRRFYPTASLPAIRDAVDFHQQVTGEVAAA